MAWSRRMHWYDSFYEELLEDLEHYIEVMSQQQVSQPPTGDAAPSNVAPPPEGAGQETASAEAPSQQPVDTGQSESKAAPSQDQGDNQLSEPEGNSSASSSENAMEIQSPTDAVNTTLANQFAVTSVALVSSQASAEVTNSSSTVPPVIVSDIPQSDSRPSRPQVIVRDIVDLGNGKSVVLPDAPDVQSGEEAGKTAQKRKADESEDDSEKVPSPKEQRKEEEGGAPAAQAGESAEPEEEEKREDIEELTKVFRWLRRRPLPSTLEEQVRRLPRTVVQEITSRLNRKAQFYRSMMGHMGPSYYESHRREPGQVFSDEDSDEENLRQAISNPQSAKYTVSDEVRLLRLLIFGGTSMARGGQMDPTKIGDFDVITRMITDGNGQQVVDILKDVSVRGRSSKLNSLLYALAMCCRSSDMPTKQAAYASFQDICRTPTHVFQIISYIEAYGESSGWGRGLRNALCNWYNNSAAKPLHLAMHLTKYWNRHGWTHRDVFRLSHIKPVNDSIGFIVRYAVKGMKEAEEEYLQEGYLGRTELEKVHKYLQAVEEVKRCEDVDRTVQLIKEHDLVREQLRTEMLNKPEIWSVMLPKMPLMALIRNLNKITAVGLFSVPEHVETVVSKLLNVTAMKKARVHPLNLLVAHHIYQRGTGERGSLKWDPNKEIVKTLEDAFYKSFDAVEPSNKRILIALDISGSMGALLSNSPIQIREAATVMAMVTYRRETHCDIVGFHQKLIPLEMFQDTSKTMEQLVDETHRLGFGATDCAKPMIWARKKKKEYDAFIIYTDSETNVHRVAPAVALEKYREKMNIPNAKLIVVGMCSNGFTIAKPDDLHMLDVAGFDPDTPEMIREFLVGGLE